jgi:GntR family transcriptional regulator
MNIIIDEESSTPIYKQIIQQVKINVSEGSLKHGDQLPSIRQLASDADINPNTVAKAFKILERDKVIVSKGFRGTFVQQSAHEHLDKNIQSRVDKELNYAIRKIRELGAIDSEIRSSFNNIMKG